MKWNVSLVVVSIGMCLFFFVLELYIHLPQAEAISEELAPAIHVNKGLLWTELNKVLGKGAVRRAIVRTSPLAILSILLVVRMATDFVAERRRSARVG